MTREGHHVRSIDDRYSNKAHLEDLDPCYDHQNDDVRDPFVLGEAKEREWIPQVGSAPLQRRGPRSPTSRNLVPRQRPGSTADWREAVRRWLLANPSGSYVACRDAIRIDGHVGVSRRDIASIARSLSRTTSSQPKKARKSTASGAAPKKQRAQESRKPKRSDTTTTKIKYCDGCDMAIQPDNGSCRC
jgi:hypothetical protein